MTDDEYEALYTTLHRLEQRWLPAQPDPSEFFDWDPLPLKDFLVVMRVAMAASRGRRFLDVGCGIGTKLAFMLGMGWDVAGIDRHKPYLDAAGELCPGAALTCADARDVEFFDADIVYMYGPARDEPLRTEIERHVIERIAPGTVLVVPTRKLRFGLRQLAPEVWVK